MGQQLRQGLSIVVALLLFGVALAVLHHQLSAYRYHDVIRAIRGVPAWQVSVAAGLAALNYAVLTLYDLIGFRFIGNRLSYSKIALASFVGYVFSHNVGVSFLGGSAVRLHLYSGWGLSVVEITKVVGLNVLTFWVGFIALLGLGLLVAPLTIPQSVGLPATAANAIGTVLLVAIGVYLLATALRRTPLRWRRWDFPVPSIRVALAQLAVSSVDWALAAGVLYVLLPPPAQPPFAHFLTVYLLAQVVGLVSHVPAGLGVFEAVMVHLLAPFAPGFTLLGSLLVYRLVYYFVPLVVAAGLFSTHELLQRRTAFARVGQALGRWVPGIVPQALAATTFLGGVILLASGATPAAHGRLSWLKDILPLPVLEVSHFMGSLAGAGLLLLARSLQRRIDAAYALTAAMLAAGAVFSLLKGLDYEEATILSIMLAVLLPCRRQFYRRAALLEQPFSAEWMAAILLVMLGIVWLLLLSYRHVEYSHALWWQFEVSGQAPRSLRATVGAVVLLLGYGAARLLRPAPPELVRPTTGDLAVVRTLVAQSLYTSSHLALLGDKLFLVNKPRTGFIMYAIGGRSWVAMGDPVGSDEAVRELAWEFRELSDRHGGWAIFYEIGPHNLPLYLDLGLSFLKLGEEGRVPLPMLTLEGGTWKTLRQVHHHVAREHFEFEVVLPSRVESLLPDLKAVSDAWLAHKHTREKAFSLGSFAPDYLKLLPVAVVRHEGRIVAFANLWLGAEQEELSVDLMRYYPETRAGLMDFLFVELLFWGKAHGYRWFNLGMAPLSGLEDRVLAPLWSRLGAFLFRHGEHFYNFQGLRQYKEKFAPTWEPRYLVSPGGLALAHILANVAALISGGAKGIVTR